MGIQLWRIDCKMSVLVGLCGGSGAGKGYVSAKFKEYGIPAIDTDAVYRELTGPSDEISDCMNALTERFGDSIRAADNSLNRAEMRKLVFGEENKKNLDELNRITHRYILEKTMSIANELFANGCDIVLIDAPLLFESGFDKLCEKNICVIADEGTRIKRIIARDNISEEDAKRRIASQITSEKLVSLADYTINNDTSEDALDKQIESCVRELEKLVK